MRSSKKTKDMIMLRSAGLSLASADRLAGARTSSSAGRIVLGGVAVLALAAAGVVAFNAPDLLPQARAALADVTDSTTEMAEAAPAAVPEKEMLDIAALETSAQTQAVAAATEAPTIEALATETLETEPTVSDVGAEIAEAQRVPTDDARASEVDIPIVAALQDAPAPENTIDAMIDTFDDSAELDCLATLAETLAGFKLNFDAGSAQVRAGDYDALVEIGTQADACPGARILVAGHSDSSGSDFLNMQLSWERAEQTTAILDKLGFDVTRFETVGFGARAPLTQGSSTDEEINRRVELHVIKDGGQL